jgi:hypothetical protein
MAAGCAASSDEDPSGDAASRESPSETPAPDPSAPSGPSDPSDPAPGDSASASAPPGGQAGSGDGLPARPSWCATGELSVALHPLNAAAGNRYAALVLTNTSDAACRTQGWPGLQLTTADGETIPTTTVRDRSESPGRLTIQPGESAWSRLHWTVVPGEADPAGGCGPDPATLRVIPPDEHDATGADWELGAVCDAGRIEALPLAEGTGPPA